MRIRGAIFILLLSLFLLNCGAKEAKLTGEIMPASGVLSGGEPVKIFGEGFKSDMGVEVFFGNKKSPEVLVEGEQYIVATTPTSDKTQIVDIRIRMDDGREFRLRKAFRYVEQNRIDIIEGFVGAGRAKKKKGR